MPTAATAVEAPPPPPAKGKKKLIIIAAAATLLLLLLAGGAALLLMKKGDAADGELEGDEPAAASQASDLAPVFVPLDSFTVNLADRDAERYAQIGITLQIESSKVGDQIKLYMPAIRNNILMLIADSTADELMGREGKARLAERVLLETSRALGHSVPAASTANLVDDGDEPGAAPRKARKAAPPDLPVKAVHFSNFIIQ